MYYVGLIFVMYSGTGNRTRGCPASFSYKQKLKADDVNPYTIPEDILKIEFIWQYHLKSQSRYRQ